MEPAPRDEPFDDPDWTFEVKWDGVRNLALVAEGRSRMFSRRLRERTSGYPDLADLAGRVQARRAVLDGELVVLGPEGRPSFPGILERDLVTSAPEAVRRAQRQPAHFMVFDILEVDGRDLLNQALSERQQRLREVVRPGGLVQLVDSFPGAGRSLFAATGEAQLEGIVCKRLDSPYRFGPDKSPLWQKVKHRLQMRCVVGGYTVTAGRTGALLLGAYDRSGKLRYLGRAGSGLAEAELRAVQEHLPPAPCPFDPEPVVGAERFVRRPDRVVWVAPRLVVLIQFHEWTDDGRLRSPVVKGFTADEPEQVRLP